MNLWFIFCKSDLLIEKTADGSFTIPYGDEPPVALKEWNTIHNITPMDDGTIVKAVRGIILSQTSLIMRCAHLGSRITSSASLSMRKPANAMRYSIGT